MSTYWNLGTCGPNNFYDIFFEKYKKKAIKCEF